MSSDFFCDNFHGILLWAKKERWWPSCRTHYLKFELQEMSTHLLLERLLVSDLIYVCSVYTHTHAGA